MRCSTCRGEEASRAWTVTRKRQKWAVELGRKETAHRLAASPKYQHSLCPHSSSTSKPCHPRSSAIGVLALPVRDTIPVHQLQYPTQPSGPQPPQNGRSTRQTALGRRRIETVAVAYSKPHAGQKAVAGVFLTLAGRILMRDRSAKVIQYL